MIDVYYSLGDDTEMHLIAENLEYSELQQLREEFESGIWVGDLCDNISDWNVSFGINDDHELYAHFIPA